MALLSLKDGNWSSAKLIKVSWGKVFLIWLYEAQYMNIP